MPIEITMPKLSDTMEEGTILRWYKHEGETVTKGELLAEVETDKADMELEAEQTGVLTEIRVKEGQAAAVGAVIAVLGADAKPAQPRSTSATPAPAAGTAAPTPSQSAPAAKPAARAPGTAPTPIKPAPQVKSAAAPP